MPENISASELARIMQELRDELLQSSATLPGIGHNRGPPLLSPELERERYVDLAEAARLRSTSVDSIKRDPELSKKIVKLSQRRVGIKLKHVLDLEDEPAA
jgi:hypothetical protein